MKIKVKKIRTLGNICKEKGVYFQTTLLGVDYCSLAFSRQIGCKYLGKKSQDNLYFCKLDRESEIIQN